LLFGIKTPNQNFEFTHLTNGVCVMLGMEYHLFGYFAKFSSPIPQVHFAKLRSSHCYLAILPSRLYLFANFILPNYYVHIAIGLFLPCCPHHLVDCQMSFKPSMRAVVWGRSLGRMEKKNQA
jgi:hypothetical protein